MSEPETQPTDSIPAAHVTDCVARSISHDGTTAMMVFKIADGTRFALTVPVAGLAAFRSLVNDVCDDADKAKIGRGMAQMKRPQNVEVGHTDQVRGHVVIAIDPRLPSEQILLLPDEGGLQMADMLQKDILGRMSPAERAARVKNAKPFLLPQRTLIVPPGGVMT